jgi:hypothetical protein
LSKHEVETHETSNSFENLEEILQQKETELDSFKKLCQEKTNEIEQLTQTMTSQIETLQSRFELLMIVLEAIHNYAISEQN